MMFRADDKANLAGSIFAGNNVMYMAVLAGAVAVVAAVVVTRKRKMKEI
ncbi:MAG: LPXTG cell wall anchor domain-containing protein [Lachnospiraceae bacterium]|nr:LPXTG cell wall anchor domain-containing protein [Lachnospiraceae bacterium]